MSHKVRHTTVVRGTYYYNRRVPAHAVEGFGQRVVRCRLGSDEDTIAALSEALTVELNAVWSAAQVKPISVERLVERLKPSKWDLSLCLDEYLSLKTINEKPSRLAVAALQGVAGNRPIDTYSRKDARDLVSFLADRGNKTGTIRRRVQSLHAVFEFGLLELNESQRNPFSRVLIPLEGEDRHQRLSFSDDQLRQIYAGAFTRNADTSLILPILGETGARLAEVVGLRWQDVCLEEQWISFEPHFARRLKTKGSKRKVPVVEHAYRALQILHSKASDSPYVFPRWERGGSFVATHASNTLNKYLKPRFDGRTCHCFRHTMRDRLRAVEAPLDLIDQIGGWQSKLGVGASYGEGYSIEHKRRWMERIVV